MRPVDASGPAPPTSPAVFAGTETDGSRADRRSDIRNREVAVKNTPDVGDVVGGAAAAGSDGGDPGLP